VITLLLGLPLTYAYGGAHAFEYLAGAGGLAVVLVYLAGNIAVIHAFRTEFRDEFSFWRHLVIPATAAVSFLFPRWGILRPPAYTLVNLLPFATLGWLCLGVIVAAVLRDRRPASFQALGRVFMPAEEEVSNSKDLDPGRGRVDVVGLPYAPASRGMSSRVKVRSRRRSRVNANHQPRMAPTRLR